MAARRRRKRAAAHGARWPGPAGCARSPERRAARDGARPLERETAPARSRHREAGFTVLALLVTVAVVNIALGVAVTSWVAIDRRQREAELLWRGQQYERALRCHQSETGALPRELEELLESNCIRQLWPDPMSADGEWEIIRLGDVEEVGEAGEGVVPGVDSPIPGAPADPGRAAEVLMRLQPRLLSTLDLSGSAFQGRQAELLARVARAREAQAAAQDAADRAAAERGGRGDGRSAPVDAAGARRQADAQLSQLMSQLEQATVSLRQTRQSLFEAYRTGGALGYQLGVQRFLEGGDVGDSPMSIVGVHSSSHQTGSRLFRGERAYDLWRFAVRGASMR